jgi:hypothetical protein
MNKPKAKKNKTSKVRNLELRYSHIPLPKIKKTKTVKPSGKSWNLFLEELNKPPVKSTQPQYKRIQYKIAKPLTLRHKADNLQLLKNELNKNQMNSLMSPLYNVKKSNRSTY